MQRAAQAQPRARGPVVMGCAVSTALACLLCNNKCSVAKVASNFAFFPPSPPSYTLQPTSGGGLKVVFSHADMQARRPLQH